MRGEEFGDDRVRYAVAAAIVLAVAFAVWFGIRKAGEYESLALSQNCAVALNRTLLFPGLAQDPDKPLSKSVYEWRDTLYWFGIDEQRPMTRSAAWLAIYFPEYMAKRCAKKMELSSLRNNETCTGPVYCGDDVLDAAREHLLVLAGERNVPGDCIDLYYSSAFQYCASVLFRSRTRGGIIKRAHLAALRPLVHPAFSGAAPVPPRAMAYRNMLLAVKCLIEIDLEGVDKERSWKNFKKAVDDAQWQNERVRDEVLRKLIDGWKNSDFYKIGPGRKTPS